MYKCQNAMTRPKRCFKDHTTSHTLSGESQGHLGSHCDHAICWKFALKPIPRDTLLSVSLEAVQSTYPRPALHAPNPSPVPTYFAEYPRWRPAAVLPFASSFKVRQGRVCQ